MEICQNRTEKAGKTNKRGRGGKTADEQQLGGVFYFEGIFYFVLNICEINCLLLSIAVIIYFTLLYNM